jgi:hypothetical protein
VALQARLRLHVMRIWAASGDSEEVRDTVLAAFDISTIPWEQTLAVSNLMTTTNTPNERPYSKYMQVDLVNAVEDDVVSDFTDGSIPSTTHSDGMELLNMTELNRFLTKSGLDEYGSNGAYAGGLWSGADLVGRSVPVQNGLNYLGYHKSFETVRNRLPIFGNKDNTYRTVMRSYDLLEQFVVVGTPLTPSTSNTWVVGWTDIPHPTMRTSTMTSPFDVVAYFAAREWITNGFTTRG